MIHLDKDAFDLHPILLAGLLMHEATHVTQWSIGEAEPYQVQSDTYRALGISGQTMNEVKARFRGSKNDEFINDITDAFEESKVKNSAWKRN